MGKIISVETGQVKTGKGQVILQSQAIGSCVAIVAYDATKHIGALAHVMLPGRAPAKKAGEKTKYAADAIDAIVSEMTRLGSQTEDIEVALVGGGNILKKKSDTICQANIESVTQILKEKRIPIRASALGGTARRSVFLDIEGGMVSYTEGDGGKTALWRA